MHYEPQCNNLRPAHPALNSGPETDLGLVSLHEPVTATLGRQVRAGIVLAQRPPTARFPVHHSTEHPPLAHETVQRRVDCPGLLQLGVEIGHGGGHLLQGISHFQTPALLGMPVVEALGHPILGFLQDAQREAIVAAGLRVAQVKL